MAPSAEMTRAQTHCAETPSAESVPALLWFHTEDYANVHLCKRWLYRHWDTQYIMEFIPNRRGGRKLCFAGYMYNKKATKKPLYSGNAVCREARTAKAFSHQCIGCILFVLKCFLESQLGHQSLL